LENISVGIAVKAMILNCMVFLTSPFYLFSKFFEGKAVEHLLGEGIRAEHLNEGRLGRALDEIFKYGVSQLSKILLRMRITININCLASPAST
jgi:transposase